MRGMGLEYLPTIDLCHSWRQIFHTFGASGYTRPEIFFPLSNAGIESLRKAKHQVKIISLPKLPLVMSEKMNSHFESSKKNIMFHHCLHPFLGGGNSNMFHFHPENWGFFFHFDLRIFFKWVGLKPPTSFVSSLLSSFEPRGATRSGNSECPVNLCEQLGVPPTFHEMTGFL